jgi:hypothetical protein
VVPAPAERRPPRGRPPPESKRGSLRPTTAAGAAPAHEGSGLKEAFDLDGGLPEGTSSLAACVATILELPLEELTPEVQGAEDPTTVRRWLAERGLGLVPVAEPLAFSWAGPWIGLLGGEAGGRAAVVMFGVPSAPVWDPDRALAARGEAPLVGGFVVAALEVALAPPAPAAPSPGEGLVEAIVLAAEAGAAPQRVERARAFAGRGLEGDRYASAAGTFDSGVAGSALTLIEAEVCDSFEPPLEAGEHRRNLITRGVELNGLVGREFEVGEVRCRGARLDEPCAVLQRYASRPVLRPLVHRGGLRADILSPGEIAVGDTIRVRD